MQQVLNLYLPEYNGLEQFIVSDSNRFAFERIKNDRDWPVAGVLLTGASGCGKTYLTHCWKAANRKGICLDNIQNWREEALFHAYNRAIQEQNLMLFTADRPPAALEIALPDLRSRLSAMTHIAIEDPDDGLLRQLLQQQFQQQQLNVKPELIDYILIQAPRQPQFMITLVRQLDLSSLQQKVGITKKLIDQCITAQVNDLDCA